MLLKNKSVMKLLDKILYKLRILKIKQKHHTSIDIKCESVDTNKGSDC